MECHKLVAFDMRIAILTLLEQLNYGGVLQAYGLSTYLKEHGYEADVLRLQISAGNENLLGKFLTPNAALRLDKLRFIFSLYRKGAWVFSETLRRLRTIRFIKYKLHTNGRSFDATELPAILSEYDVVVVGSDQIWNPNYYGLNNPFLLEDIHHIRKIAYAASFGVDVIPEWYRGKYAAALTDFSHISCRESCGCDIVESMIGRRSEWVVDPVLLLSQEEWGRMVDGVGNEKYIMAYWCGELSSLHAILKKVRIKTNQPIKLLLTEWGYRSDIYQNGNKLLHSILKEIKGVIPCFNAGPAEFLKILAHSSAVLTDSFHGMVFSIVFEKSFGIYLAQSGERARIHGRILDFVSRIKLEKSDLFDHENVLFTESHPIEFYDSLAIWRKDSVNYLREVLK